MNHPTLNIVVISTLLLMSCTFDSKQLSALESKKWKSDNIGCDGYRKNVYKAVFDEFELIKGTNEIGFVKLFGKPNEIVLYDRGQKFYIYYVQCKSNTDLTKSLKIRFNALGLASEIVVIIN